MQPYPKIKTVWKRDPDNRYKTLLENQFSMPEFAYLAGNPWVWTEKIDGTNIRVMWSDVAGRYQVRFGGKTNRAQLYTPLVWRLRELFPEELLTEVLGEDSNFCLYGEGYGAKIQKGGGNYIPDGVDFILFDVLAGDDLWLERENVEDIAGKLGIQVVPIVYTGTLYAAIGIVRHHTAPLSLVAATPHTPMEGLVMRPAVELRNRRGGRIITKIKHKDFPEG